MVVALSRACPIYACEGVVNDVEIAQVAIPYIRAKAHDYFEDVGCGSHVDILDDEPRSGVTEGEEVCGEMDSPIDANRH